LALKAELAEGRVKEEAPLAVVSLVHVEGDRNMVPDGEPLNLRSGGGSDGPSSEEESEWLEEGAMGAEDAAKGC
jgi:hypothetical protein